MKFTLPVFFLISVFLSCYAAEKRISFSRPSKPGDFFNAEINLTAEREYKFILPGPDKPIERRESLVATLFADLKVLSVNSDGSPTRLELRISNAGGYINGVRFDSALLNGKNITADLEGKPVFTDQATGQPVAQSAAVLLGAMFRPPSGDTLQNTLGNSAPLIPGHKWKISACPVIKSLQARGLQVSSDSINAEAKIAEKEKFRNIESCRVEINIASGGVSTLDFRLRATVWIPLDPAQNIIRTVRNGVEVIDTVLPSDNPLAAGSSVRVITRENLEAVLIPSEDKKELPQKKSWSDFILR